jgi:hypothetical protein
VHWITSILGLGLIATPLVPGFSAQVWLLNASLMLGTMVVILTGYQPLFAYSRNR